MKTTQSLRRILGGVFLGLLLGAPVHAAPSPDADFIASVTGDYNNISSYLNNELARTFGFYSTLGWPTSPEVLNLMSGPRGEIGVGLGVDLVKVNLDSLPLNALSPDSNINIPGVLPLPFPIWQAKIGLFKDLDFGLRGTGYPRIERDQISTANRGWGFEVRYQALSGVKYPSVTVNVSWDRMQGDIYFHTNIDQQSTYVDSGTTYASTLSGQSVYMNAWDVHSFGVKVVVGKNLGIFHPFGAMGIQRQGGQVTSRFQVDVQEALSSGGVPVVGTGQNVHLDLTNVALPPVLQPKYILGFELGTGFRWSNVFETNGRDRSFSTSFRVQI